MRIMIRMTRLRLINWHNFQDDVIEFKYITYLLGVNAVGKTTIMDAIRYCLTTNKDFNTAGNKKSGRTLLGSVHQKQRAEDSYLRSGHTVSYIGIEFIDESIHKTFVITVRVESETPKQDLRGVYQDWYITKPGYQLEDIPYFTYIKDGKRPTSRDAFKLDNKGMDRASNQADARRRICRVLGIGDADSLMGKKFNEVFHMGTSLEDIRDIREFIYTYILPEPEVNIDFLQKDMKELEHLQEILQETQDREQLLAQINSEIAEAKILLSKVKINELLVAYAGYQGNLEEQQEKQKLVDECSSNIKNLIEELNELSVKERKAQTLLYEARKAADENEENKEMLSLEQENKDNQEEYNRLVAEAAIYEEISTDLNALKKSLRRSDIYCEWDEELIWSEDVDARLSEIKKASRALDEVKEIIKDRDFFVRSEYKRLEKECRALEDKIKSLEAGVMVYPEEAIMVKNCINKELVELGKDTDARLLCELLYITDNSWQDAVESYLNTQRFNIIVAPECYLIAKRVFISLGDKVKGIGLVDTRNIREISYNDKQSKYLSNVVESENIYAKRYVNFVMKDVVCSDLSDELELYKKSVTRERLRFQNYSLHRMKKQEHYIGIDVIAKHLVDAKTKLLAQQGELRNLKSEQNSFDAVVDAYNKFITGDSFSILEKYCGSKTKAEKLQEKIKDIAEKIEEFKKNPILLAMYNRIEECSGNVKAINEEKIDLAAKKQNHEDKIKESNSRIGELKKTVDSLKSEYEECLKETPEYASDVELKYQEERKTKSASSIAYNFRNRATQDNNALNNYMNQKLLPLQREYTRTYVCDIPEGIDGATRYNQEYVSLKNIEIERHKEALAQAQVRCKERFRKEVLFRMKDDIQRAKQQFRQINRVMEKLEYGEESYRFGIDKSKDKELGLFYDIIMDKENLQIEQDNAIMAFLAEENKSELFESQIEDFMNRIMIDVEEHAKDNLTGRKSGAKSMGVYVDYRTYLDYDIIVKNSVTGLEVELSKVSGEGSGGENQAPFYVAICASLLQIYEQNPEGCMRLILLDEAFNNMTSDRIEPMMNMFKKLNLQLVLIATAEKATSILPYCDITYSIVKSGNRNAIGVFERI